MYPSLLILATGLLQVANLVNAMPNNNLFERQACNADNCLRAVRGTSVGVADCSSFLRTTLVGCGSATATVTSTVVVSSTAVSTRFTTVGAIPTGPGGPVKRQAGSCSTRTISPSSFPTYASLCSDITRYSSACSCVGATGPVTTISAGAGSTTTVRTTTTAVTTSVAVVTQQPSSNPFQLVLPGGRKVAIRSSDNALIPTSSTNPTPLSFVLTNDATVRIEGIAGSPRLGVKANTGRDIVYGLNAADAGTRLVCTLSNPASSNGALVCNAGGDQRFPVLCNEVIYYSITRDQPGCAAIDLQAV